MIDLNRADELINGLIEPKNRAEELFLLSYNSGVSQELFFHCLMSLGHVLDEITIEEAHYIMIGYAMGQNDDLSHELDELLTNNKQTH